MPGPGFSSPKRPDKGRTTVPVRGRSPARMPMVLPSLTTGRSHLGNLGLRLAREGGIIPGRSVALAGERAVFAG